MTAHAAADGDMERSCCVPSALSKTNKLKQQLALTLQKDWDGSSALALARRDGLFLAEIIVAIFVRSITQTTAFVGSTCRVT